MRQCKDGSHFRLYSFLTFQMVVTPHCSRWSWRFLINFCYQLDNLKSILKMVFTTMICCSMPFRNMNQPSPFIFNQLEFFSAEGKNFSVYTKHVQQNKNAFRRGSKGYFSLFLASLFPLKQVTGVSAVDQLTDQQFY